MIVFSFKDLMDVHTTSRLNKQQAKVIHGLIIIICWVIWNSRNEKRFINKSCKAEDMVLAVKSCGFLWLKYRSRCSIVFWVEWCKFPLYMYGM
ncbi:hypothetical protein HanIR_Chr05g0246871 [Helianthus annuus]|nr:hypothetical protein HanIR_Chr05g0246871 [Helianthus annuus]